MNYVDIDKVRAEIKRRIADNTFGAKLELMDILAWLDTLECGISEKPNDQEPEVDFQFALDKYIGDLDEALSKAGCTYEFDWDDITVTIREAARHFYDLGKGDRDTIFHKGMMYYRKQMMEEAVEADVNTYCDLAAGKSWAEFVVEMPINNLGDKVRIIVLPKEDAE